MSEKLLFVDDEPNVLQSIKRGLRKRFDLTTAEGGAQALELMKSSGPFAVIVSDMRMPGMDGVEFLSLAKQQAPDSVRMMLTGNADQETAVAAVNEGDIFRFLNKPCDTESLATALDLALNQHRLIIAERDLLENTLRGSIRAMAEVLSLTNPEVFGRTTRFKSFMNKLATELGYCDLWRLETVALLSQIGCVTVPEAVIKKRVSGKFLADEELLEFHKHTLIGAQLLSAIPRMEEIADCIRYQEKNFDGSGFPDDEVCGEKIPLGARLLRIIIDFDAQESRDGNSKAIAFLKQNAQRYDPAMLNAFESILRNESALEARPVKLSAVTDGMVLAEDIYTTTDILLVPKGQETTASVRGHLRNFFEKNLIDDTVTVWQDARIEATA
ncbi:MAG: response regulator [Gammaproteobacteria bacterium]|nr:response regulator [Gammaproteobacteria bacterium]MDH3767621.1 response regulator [Gammaproteobacteria bacterium]